MHMQVHLDKQSLRHRHDTIDGVLVYREIKTASCKRHKLYCFLVAQLLFSSSSRIYGTILPLQPATPTDSPRISLL
jgi:hypothetical protein